MLNSNPKLLLIEDCNLNIKIFDDILNKINNMDFIPCKFDFVVKTNLKDTKDYLQEEAPDIIISDLTLPDALAADTIEYLKNYTHDIPIIILTAEDHSSVAIQAIQEGFQDYLVKGEFNHNTIYRSIMYSIERHKLINKMKTISLIDELTCLYNRRGFKALTEKYYKLLRRENKGAGILYIDLNDLKVINDTYGHKAGDSAIIQTANLLQKYSRSSDVVARLGGDEFAVFLYNCVSEKPEILKDRLNKIVDEHNQRQLYSYEISLSMGFVYCDCNKDDLDDCITRADKLMYEDKVRKKKNRQANYTR